MNAMTVAGILAFLAALPGLVYLPSLGGGKPLGDALFVLVCVLMPVAWILGRRLATTPRAAAVLAWGIGLLSLLGLVAHLGVFTSGEPLGALALIVFLLPAQILGLVMIFALVVLGRRSDN